MSHVLDIVDYQAKANLIAESDVQTLVAQPTVRAAVAAYASGLITLGYAAFFSWDESRAALQNLAPERLMDLIRYVARRHKLDASDHRHIAIDHDWAFATFPRLLARTNYNRLQEVHREFMAEMGDFLDAHPWKFAYPASIRSAEETDYAKYWLESSSHRIAPLLADRRFLAGLDAFRQGLLSYGGLTENVYGERGRVLFPEIGYELSTLVLVQLAASINDGKLAIPSNLRKEFPEFYEIYHPEAFGPRPKA